MRDHARDLLDEREETAREVAAELTRAVAATVRAHRAYVAERQHVDQLVSAVPEASARYDGTSTSYPWADALRELERAYRENSEATAPRPRWAGVAQRRNVDALHRQLQAQRKQRIVDAVEP
jgi:hypothetical protein